MESRVLMVVLNRAAPLAGEKQGGVDEEEQSSRDVHPERGGLRAPVAEDDDGIGERGERDDQHEQAGGDVAGEGDECQTEEPDARVSYALHGEVGRVSVLLGWDAVSGGGDARCDEEPHTDCHDGEAEHDGESGGDGDEHDFLRGQAMRLTPRATTARPCSTARSTMMWS